MKTLKIVSKHLLPAVLAHCINTNLPSKFEAPIDQSAADVLNVSLWFVYSAWRFITSSVFVSSHWLTLTSSSVKWSRSLEKSMQTLSASPGRWTLACMLASLWRSSSLKIAQQLSFHWLWPAVTSHQTTGEHLLLLLQWSLHLVCHDFFFRLDSVAIITKRDVTAV